MKKNRLTFIGFILFLTFGILIFRLFNITIVNGKYHRDQADNTRKKQINEKAARGNIYDRNGNILAGNRPVYNIDVYMDRFKSVSNEDKNEVLLNLVHILEEDGVSYLEDFFVGIYKYKFKFESDYFREESTPVSKMVDIIIDNKLTEKIINAREAIDEDAGIFYYPINRIIDYLDERGKNYPIEVTTGENLEINFIANDRYQELLDNKQISKKTSAKEFLISKISEDKSLFFYLLDHPLSRKLIYDITVSMGIETGIELTELAYNSDIDYVENKAKLNKLSSSITMDSNPEDDFRALVRDNSLDGLLTVVSFDENKKTIVPAELLINKINALGVESEVTFELNQAEEKVILKYADGKNRAEKPIDYLIRLAKEYDLIDEFITNDKVIRLAEQSLFNKNIYPRILRNTWTYVFEKEKADLLERNKVKKDTSAKDLIEVYKERYKLYDYSDYESFGIISVYNKIISKGYKAYEPVTLAKNISERTLVEVEEKMPKDLGFEIVVQPSRNYPYGHSLSHVLGYLGKISDEYEIKEYVEHRKYSADDVIGKTGLEESYEDTLRGTNGRTIVYTDVYGNTTDTIEQIPPVPGNNLQTTIDINYQKDLENILRDIIKAKSKGEDYYSYYGKTTVDEVPEMETGAIVVSDVKTGDILASVSYPDYDPNIFVNGVSNNDWDQLTKNEDSNIYSGKPLLNMVTQGAVPPGSTFKTVIALDALENGLDPKENITCHGFIDLGNTRFNCLIYTLNGGTHGPIDLYEALRVSCNYYFYALGLGRNPKENDKENVKVSLKDIEATITKLGLDKITGVEINIPNESKGFSPNLYGKQNLVRNMLRNFLNKKLPEYVMKDNEKTPEDYLNDVNEIATWVEDGPKMTRNQVIKQLNELGYNALKPLKNERTGLADKIKYSYLNQALWSESDSLNMVIGQGQNAYTPIQLNMLANTIANEGKQVKPTFIKKINNFDNTKEIFVNEVREHNVGISQESFAHVKEGMRRAGESNRHHKKLPFAIGVKTGTAQSDSINPKTGEKYKNFVWEINFAPFEEPEIAVTVLLVQGNVSTDAALVANDVIYSYFKNVKKDPLFTNERVDSESEKDPTKIPDVNGEITEDGQVDPPGVVDQEHEEEENVVIPNYENFQEVEFGD